MIKISNTSLLLVFLFTVVTMLSGCSTDRHTTRADDPPILSQDELIRPYIKIGRIQVTREVYITDYSIPPDIRTWSFSAVRQEAGKLGADAVILPEVTERRTTNGIFPMTEYIATGFAIKFK